MQFINLIDVFIVLLASLIVATNNGQVAVFVRVYDFPSLLVCEIKRSTFIDYAGNLRSIFPVQEYLEFTIFDRPCVPQIYVIIYNFYSVKIYPAISRSTQRSY